MSVEKPIEFECADESGATRSVLVVMPAIPRQYNKHWQLATTENLAVAGFVPASRLAAAEAVVEDATELAQWVSTLTWYLPQSVKDRCARILASRPSEQAPPDEQRGLYRKYRVERLHDPAGKHRDCTYFVLDEVHDKYAAAALRAYAEACEGDFPQLAAELRRRWCETCGGDGLAARGGPCLDCATSEQASKEARAPYYLIERTDLGQPHWLAWRERGDKAWVPNAHDADRYESRVGAEQDARGVRNNLPMFAQYIVVTEHLDVAGRENSGLLADDEVEHEGRIAMRWSEILQEGEPRPFRAFRKGYHVARQVLETQVAEAKAELSTCEELRANGSAVFCKQRDELSELRREVEGENGLRASKDAGWALANARLADVAAMRAKLEAAEVESAHLAQAIGRVAAANESCFKETMKALEQSRASAATEEPKPWTPTAGDRVRNSLSSTDLGTVQPCQPGFEQFGAPVVWDKSPGQLFYVSVAQLVRVEEPKPQQCANGMCLLPLGHDGPHRVRTPEWMVPQPNPQGTERLGGPVDSFQERLLANSAEMLAVSREGLKLYGRIADALERLGSND